MISYFGFNSDRKSTFSTRNLLQSHMMTPLKVKMEFQIFVLIRHKILAQKNSISNFKKNVMITFARFACNTYV